MTGLREASIRSFRAGQSLVLISTGISARDIDIRNVMHVINYDLPSIEHGGIEEYTHRISRTGRIGHRVWRLRSSRTVINPSPRF